MSRLRGYKKKTGYYEEAVKTFSFSVSVAFVGELPSSLDELPLGPPSLLLFSAPPFLVASGAFFPLQLHFRFSLINLFTCWCETKKRVGWWNVFLLNFVKKTVSLLSSPPVTVLSSPRITRHIQELSAHSKTLNMILKFLIQKEE